MRGRTFATLYTIVRVCLLLSLTIGRSSPVRSTRSRSTRSTGRPTSAGSHIALPGVRLALWLGGAITVLSGFARGAPHAQGPARTGRGARDARRSMTFIVLEGGEGVGKSTQVDAAGGAPAKPTGRVVVQTREPGGTQKGARAAAEAAARSRRRRSRRRARSHARRTGAIHVEEVIEPDAREREGRRVRPVLAVDASRTKASRGAWAWSSWNGAVVRSPATSSPTSWSCSTCPTTSPRAASPAPVIASSGPAPSSTRRCAPAYRELAPARGWVVVDARGLADEVAARVWAVVEPRL